MRGPLSRSAFYRANGTCVSKGPPNAATRTSLKATLARQWARYENGPSSPSLSERETRRLPLRLLRPTPVRIGRIVNGPFPVKCMSITIPTAYPNVTQTVAVRLTAATAECSIDICVASHSLGEHSLRPIFSTLLRGWWPSVIAGCLIRYPCW